MKDNPDKDAALVDEAAEESFPASDPPAWTATHAGAPSAVRPRIELPRELRQCLRADVEALVLARGEARTEHITTSLLDAGRPVTRIPLALAPPNDVDTIEAVIRGANEGRELVIGASYDAGRGTPRPDRGAANIAVLLALARLLAGRRYARTVRLVAFANAPAISGASRTAGAPGMIAIRGSRAYARRLREQNIDVCAMLGLHSVGFAPDRVRVSSRLPFGILRPWRGDFVAFVGSRKHRALLREACAAFRLATDLEARARALPAILPLVAVSDHRAFAREGIPAIMITDAGPVRSFDIAEAGELPARLDYGLMADVVFGLAAIVVRLAEGDAELSPCAA